MAVSQGICSIGHTLLSSEVFILTTTHNNFVRIYTCRLFSTKQGDCYATQGSIYDGVMFMMPYNQT